MPRTSFRASARPPCDDDLTAKISRRQNDANILCFSADLPGERLLDRVIEPGDQRIEGGRHSRRIEKIRTAAEIAAWNWKSRPGKDKK